MPDSIRAPFSDEPSQKVGTLAERVKLATQDVQRYQKAILDAKSSGREITSMQASGYKAAQADADKLQASLRENKRALQDFRSGKMLGRAALSGARGLSRAIGSGIDRAHSRGVRGLNDVGGMKSQN